ncbi:hypothetical protein [Kitasatospora sp. NPDC008115]|uniref:DUF7507 domain-containing protein n=1 Tax=Kitasatospora sp. NPDC008115 TaxID=3364022 RepID=UPI0036E38FCB
MLSGLLGTFGALIGRSGGLRRVAPVATAVLIVIAAVPLLTLGGVAPSASATSPGTPGTPQAPTLVYSEDFQNAPVAGATRIDQYRSATGMAYTADPAYLNPALCNGLVFGSQATDAALTAQGFCFAAWYPSARTIPNALGQYRGLAAPTTNLAVAEQTGAGNAYAGVMLQGTGIALPAPGRFLTFSLDVGNLCNAGVQALDRFYLLDGASVVALNSIDYNICADPGRKTYNVNGAIVSVGTFVGDQAKLVAGSTVGFRLENRRASGSGNDQSFDNFRILDVTPQLDKSFSPISVTTGGISKLTFTVTNTNELAAKNGWSFKDSLPAGLTVAASPAVSTTCPAGVVTAAAGATSVQVSGNLDAGMASCTASVDVTSSSSGSFTNGPGNVTVTGLNLPGSSTVVFEKPALSLVKSADAPVDVNGDGLADAGDTIQYRFKVENTGDVTVSGIVVNDPLAGAVACQASTLAPGASTTCTANKVYTVTGADAAAGAVENTATASGTSPAGASVRSGEAQTRTPLTTPDPKISLVKSVSPSDEESFTAGQTLTYSFVVTNTGNVTLKDVKVTEGTFTGTGTPPVATCPAAQTASLAPGASMTCTATYTVTQADVDAGSIKNSATVTGNPPTGPPPVSPPSEVTVPAPSDPALTVVKSASTGSLVVGEKVTYSFRVTNTGNVTLKDVKVTEGAFTGSGTLDPVVCPSRAASLAPGESVVCTAGYTVTQTDVDAGSVKNSATGTGTPPRGEPPVSPPTETTITTTDQPGLVVVKTGHSSKPDQLVLGEQVRYDFAVTNTGNVTLKDVKVTEGAFTGSGTLSPVTCPATEAASLAPGASMTCTATYTVTQADVDAGSIKNTATATGTPPRGEPPVSPPSETVVPAPEKPALAVVKTSSTGTLVAGEEITYAFAVTNTGNVTLKDVTIKEGQFTGSGKLSPVICPKDTATSLTPGATVLCTATYTVTQADVDAGSVKNAATATGTPPKGVPPVSPPSETTINTQDQTGLSVVKSATSGTDDKLVAGEKITYSFAVRNTGNVTLKDIKITEGEFTGHGTLDPITCPKEAANLAPGTTVTCTTTYTVTQADVDAGSVKNTATATGTPPRGEPPVSPPSEVELPQTPKPALTVVKSAETEKPGKLVAGEKVAYKFAVTNTGNVTIKDVKVNEGEFTGTGKLSPVVCPKDGAASLAPGATVQCTAGYTVTQADVDEGTIRNTATGTGTPPKGEPPVSPPSEVTVPSNGQGALGLTKTADVTDVNGNGKTDTGDRIDWKLTVANQGTTTVTGIKVNDPTAGEVTCPRTSLAPGETMVCTTKPHTITTEDAQRGKVVNTATATGTGATSPEATATVKVEPDPVTPAKPASPEPGPTGILARTGTAVLTTAGIATALLAIGGLALTLSRRRRNN